MENLKTNKNCQTPRNSHVEFQAIILADNCEETNMFQLVDDSHPASLLNFGNRPLLAFQLDILEQAEFSDAIVVCYSSHSSLLTKQCEEIYDGQISIYVATVEDMIGTAEILRQIRHLIKNDFMIISGDLITNVEINRLADIHRTHDAAVTCLFQKEGSTNFNGNNRNISKKTFGKQSDSSIDRYSLKHFVGLESSSNNRLLFFRPYLNDFEEADLDDEAFYNSGNENIDIEYDYSTNQNINGKNKFVSGIFGAGSSDDDDNRSSSASTTVDKLRIDRQLFLKYPSIRIHSNLRSSHCFIFSRQILDLLNKKNSIKSIENELIPFITKNQFNLKQKDLLDCVSFNSQNLAFSMTNSSQRGPPGTMPDPNRSCSVDEDPIRCFGYICPLEKYCCRLMLLEDYKSINMSMISNLSSKKFPQASKMKKCNNLSSVINEFPSAQFGPNCIIDSFSKFGDNSSIKRCIVGKHCRIGSKVRLIGSVIMDHVVIEDNCTIKDSIICCNSTIQSDSNIDNVFIGYSVSLNSRSNKKNDIVVANEIIIDLNN